MATDTHRTIDALWRIESARLIAGLTRVVRDVGLAEELAQDALVCALEQWPRSGVPDNPGAWLMATAKHRAIDALRRGTLVARKHEDLAHELERSMEPDLAAALDDHVGDDLLRLIFIACHPVLPAEGRVALTLRLLGGLTTPEIARAFLVPEATIAQRIVRAKRTLAEAGVPFEVPRGAERVERLSSVLGVIYLVFNEGYSATAGEDWMRPSLCEDALRLGRVLAQLSPQEPEVHGLVALMELQASRAPARLGPGGAPVLLLDQDRARWDQLLIRRGLAALERAQSFGVPGPYLLQAAIAACHARAHTAAQTDWPAHRRAVRRAGPAHPLSGDRAQPGRGALDGLRSRRRPGAGGAAPGRARARGLPSAAHRARRPAGEAGPLRRGPGGVRAGGRAHPECPGAGALERARAGLCRFSDSSFDV